MFDLTGRVALVTGASRGLGRVFARVLAGAGADLILTSRDPAKLSPVCDEVAALGRRAVPLALEVRDRESLTRLGPAARDAFGRIDILVNNAGCNVRKPTLDVTWEDWNQVIDTNLRGTFFVAQAVGRTMIEQRYGRIINIGSLTSLLGYEGIAPYCASRGGIRQLTASLAAEWGRHGITVNTLAPGWIRTDLNGVLFDDEAWAASLRARIPMGRPGQPDDLASGLLFLAAAESAYVTGQLLVVDGGKSTGAFSALPRSVG